MLFSEMIAKAAVRLNIKTDFEVNKLCYNSRFVEPNDIFFALRGFKFDGNKFIGEAASKGAGAILTDSPFEGGKGDDVPVYPVANARKTMAVFSNVFYDFPSRKVNLIGVTGTNGKTTVTSVINHILRSSGKKTGLIGTNGYLIGNRQVKASHTTPESVDLNALLHVMVRENIEFVTMEVSSHSLSLDRVYGLDFDTVAFTNLSPEHLDFHQDMTKYFNAKKILFDSMPEKNAKGHVTCAVYNKDDEYGSMITANTKAKTISFGFHDSHYIAANVSMSFDGLSFDLITPDNTLKIKSKLTGKFNVYNTLCAFASLRQFDVPAQQIIRAIENFPPVEGRFNIFKVSNGAYAIVDYAHTPDSLYNALITIKDIGASRIITVFGCGGDRDKSKRPVMGALASKHSDVVIITSDNPRFEEPMAIIKEIKSGIQSNNYFIEEDRRAAITRAIEMSREGDVILIAGKGHELYQEIKGTKYQLSDIEIVQRFC